MSQKSVISDLKESSERVGRLYPIILDRYGNVIDGQHRLVADENWPKKRLENVETEEQRLIARLISNACRRLVPAKEKRELLERLGEIFMDSGVEPGRIAHKMAEKTGMSYTWVVKYLPEKFKDCIKSENARVTRRVAKTTSIEFEEPPKGAVAIKNYTNTSFVNVVLGKKFFIQLEEKAKRLEITPEKLLYNAILLTLKSLE